MMAAVMGSFGERLQREREMRGITLEEMSESTKITSRCLRALEEEEFDKLPGGIFNKGFVRAYADHLGIDEDQAVADFVVASGGEKDQPLPDPVQPRAVVLGQRAEGHLNWRALALPGLLFATVVVAAWKLGPAAFHRVNGGPTARSNPAPAPPTPQPAADIPAPVSPPVLPPAPQSASNVPAPAPPTPQSAPDASAPAPPAPQSVPEAPAPAPPPPRASTRKNKAAKTKPVAVAVKAPAATSPAPPAAPASSSSQTPSRAFVVHVRATQDAWVQIVADGKLVSEGVLVPPAEKRVPAAKEVVIKTGNAAGVEVSFNGQPLPTLGEENQMATVTLTAAGVRR